MSKDKRNQVVEALMEAAMGTREREAYQKALGALVINFSFLHFHLEMFSWNIFEVDHYTGQILTKDLPLKQLIQKVRSCASHREIHRADRIQFERLLRDIEKASERRNDLMHDLWLIHEGQPTFCYKRRGRAKVPAPSIQNITSFNRSIQTLTGELIDFKDKSPIRTPSFIGTGHPSEQVR